MSYAHFDPDISSMISEAVECALNQSCYVSFSDMGDNGEVTPEAVQRTRERLLAFPDICLRAQEAEGAERVVLDYEIWAVKNALTGISDDQFYQIVPDLYLRRLNIRKVCYRANCDLQTLHNHLRRLLYELAFLLYGAAARWRHPLIDLPPNVQYAE